MRLTLRRLATSSAAVALLASLASAPHSTASARGFTPFRVNGEPMRAITLTEQRQFASLSIPDYARIRADGFNTVTIYVYRYLDSAVANEAKSGPFTEPDALLGAAIDQAHGAGLAVQLIPTIWVGTGVGPFYWRGEIHPTDHNLFFDSYRAMTNHYADLATQHGVELFGIGSEMISLENEVAQWQHTISDARQHFRGPISYFTVYGTIDRIRWWRYVDYPGVSPYMSLSTTPQPSYDEIVKAWKRVNLPYLRKVQAYVGRPLMVSEIGYASSVGAATHPEHGGVGAPNQDVQTTLYAALLDTVLSEKGFDGVSFYRWSAYEDGPVDNGFSPKGKSVECMLAKRWNPTGLSAAQCATLGAVAG